MEGEIEVEMETGRGGGGKEWWGEEGEKGSELHELVSFMSTIIPVRVSVFDAVDSV